MATVYRKLEQDYREVFTLLDKDRDGKITRTELARVMRVFGTIPTESELESVMNEYDYDGDGRLNVNEFIALMADKVLDTDAFENDILKIFHKCDKDGDGYIFQSDLAPIMNSLTTTNEQIMETIRSVNLNGKRKLNYWEFRRLWKSLL